MPDPMKLSGQAITRVGGGASQSQAYQAQASAFSGIADAATAIGRVVNEREKASASKDAVADFAKLERDGSAPAVLPSKRLNILGFELETEADQLYNLTAQKLAVDHAVLDAQDQVATLTAEFENQPEKLASALDAWSSGYLEQADPSVASEIELAIGSRIETAVTAERASRIKADRAESQQNSINAIARLTTERAELVEKEGFAALEGAHYQRLQQELGDHVDLLVSDPTAGYGDEWGAGVLDEAADADMTAAVGAEARLLAEQAYGEGGWQAANAAVDTALESYGDTLSLQQMDLARARATKWIEEQERESAKSEREADAARVERQAGNYNQARRSFADDSLSFGELDVMAAQGDISDQQYTALYEQMRNRTRTASAESAADARIHSGLFDPTDTDDRKAINRYYQGLVSEEGADAGQAIYGIVEQFGVVPDDAGRSLRAAYYNGEPEQKQIALDTIAQIDEMKPGAAAAEFKGSELRDARLYRDVVDATGDVALGMTRVLQAQEARIDPAFDDMLDQARKTAAENINDQDLRAAFDKDSGTFFSDPKLPADFGARAALRREYEEEYAQTLAETGDEKVAASAATSRLRRTYGVSRVGGRAEVMRHPPENYYSVPGQRPDWIHQEFMTDVAEMAPKMQPRNVFELVAGLQEPDIRDARLVSDHLTAREAAGGAPSYAVTIVRGDGTVEALMGDNGSPLRWRPDAAGEGERVRTRREETVAAASASRDARLASRQRREEFDLNEGGYYGAGGVSSRIAEEDQPLDPASLPATSF